MEEKKDKRQKKIRNYVIICAMLAIILSVSTYAWFIGLQDVKVSAFDVNIKAAESLMLSLDGSRWDYTVTINSSNYTSVAYTNNTNSWGGQGGLIPMSSVGEIDPTSSTMKIFEKASLTATPDGLKTATAGGYRLLASRVDNTVLGTGGTGVEQPGYVVFDLFVKNFSGTEYYTEYNILNEEAIYLTTDSKVTVASTGVENTGIENSVRVAFAPIGRVIATTENGSTSITGLKCGTATATAITDPTSICRDAQIWEPNDKNHVAGAISWYNTSCRTRIAEDITLKTAYSDSTCTTVADGTANDTYAVRDVVNIADKIDIYDGEDYNTYANTIMEYATSDKIATYTSGVKKLEAYPYFTDSDKILTGTARPTFMTLAPNSITKVRVYVWIEGQDIDNYDYASAGKAISVGFGFTKERYVTTDVNYEGPFVANQYVYTNGLFNGDGSTYVEASSLEDFTAACTALGGQVGIDGSSNKVCAQQYHFFSADIDGPKKYLNTNEGLQVYPYQDKVHF